MVHAIVLDRSELNDQRWDEFVQSSPQNTIYLYSWYLDAVCDSWKAILVTKEDQWLAVMPMNSKTKLSVHYLLQPHFTQFMGIAYAGDMKLQKRPYEDYKLILKSVVNVIPDSAKLIRFNFHPSVKYLMPFHWADYNIQVRYTYWLELKDSMEAIRSNYSKSLKNELKLASKHQLKIAKTDSINDLAGFLRKRNIINDTGENTLKILWEQVMKRNKGYVLHAVDQAGNIQGAIALIKEDNRLVYFQGSSAGKEKNGANTFLIDKAITNAHEDKQVSFFDFEGSMIESIEHYFRSFKPSLKTYYCIDKNNMPAWVALSLKLKNKLKKG